MYKIHLTRVEISYANALPWLQISGVRGPSAGPSHVQYCSLNDMEGRFCPEICYTMQSLQTATSFPAFIYSREWTSLTMLSSAAGDVAFSIQTFINGGQHPAYCNLSSDKCTWYLHRNPAANNSKCQILVSGVTGTILLNCNRLNTNINMCLC